MLGEFLSKGSHLAQQQVASLGSAAIAARERALGLGVAAAETAAQKLEGVARELRERGRRGSQHVGEERRQEDVDMGQADLGIGSKQVCKNVSMGASAPRQATDAASVSTLPMGLPAEQEAFLAAVGAAEAAELSGRSTPPHPSSSTTLQGYIQPCSSVSLASTVIVPPAMEVQASESSKQDVGQDLQSRQTWQPGTWLEVCCKDLGSWRVGCIAECVGEHELSVNLLKLNGSIERNILARDDLSLAVLGTHVQTPPPGFESRPSVSRPGRLTYTCLATGAEYQFLEHAWQEYFNTLGRLMHASTCKVLKPDACDTIRERLLEEVAHARETIPTDDLVAFPTRTIPENTAPNTNPAVAQPTALIEPTVNFNAFAVASAAALIAPLPVPRVGRLSVPAVPAASSMSAHGGFSQARHVCQPQSAQPHPQPQPQLKSTLPQTHMPNWRWCAATQDATSVQVQVQGGSRTGVPAMPAAAARSVTARGWPAVTLQPPVVRA